MGLCVCVVEKPVNPKCGLAPCGVCHVGNRHDNRRIVLFTAVSQRPAVTVLYFPDRLSSTSTGVKKEGKCGLLQPF